VSNGRPQSTPVEARTLDLDAYCRRIGLRGALAPTRDCLVRLIQCHAMAIPFENIEVLARRVPVLDTDSLQRKMVQQRRGGYCFEQNQLFRGVLLACGFDAHPLEARIRVGVPADVVTARTHLATRVVLDGVDHLTFRPESAAPVEQTLQTRAEFADVFADGFGPDVAPADLDAVMAALDRLPPS
jgi:N-hydroxyarylamine O-acetyltransferase